MVCSCCAASKASSHRRPQAAWYGKARKALLVTYPSIPVGHLASYALSGFFSHQRPCVVRDQICLDRGNIAHACAPAPGAAAAGGSNTIPRMQDTASHASHDAVPEPLCPELPTPQKRPGVPVYVMLPLDTVSLSTFCQSRCPQSVSSKEPVFLQVNSNGQFQYASTSWFRRALGLLQASGVEGIAVDVWVSTNT